MSLTTADESASLGELLDSYLRQPSAEQAQRLHNLMTQCEERGEERSCHAIRAALAEEELNQGVYETLAAAISQLQTPFNMLNAALEMLQRRSNGKDERLMTVLLAVRDQGLATLESLQRVLPERTTVTQVTLNLNQLVHEVLMISTPRLLASGIVIDWHPQPVLPVMQGDDGRLRCMLKKLLDNAILAIEQYRNIERTIRIDSSERDGWLQLVIHDSGPGIGDAERLRVFEPFYSNWPRTSHHHTGMGLSLVQETINQHGGVLEIDPHTTQGCRIVIHFPLCNGNHV